MFDGDLIGWELDDVLDEFRVRIDDVLEGSVVDFVVEGVAIDSCGEPCDPLLDGDVRKRLDGATRRTWYVHSCGENREQCKCREPRPEDLAA